MRKIVFIILALLLTIAVKAQDFKSFYTIENDGSVELDITNYNLDERFFTIYNIFKDNRFELFEGKAYGLFKIFSKENIGEFLTKLHGDFTEISKYDLAELLDTEKSELPTAFVTSILFDLSIRAIDATTDNDHCDSSEPFCTSDIITFEASHNTNAMNDPIPDQGCLGVSYNPSWYHMRINTPGQFIIHMEGVDPNNPNTHRDIDYCIWGPYTDPTSPCLAQLNTAHLIDCSYSTSYSENVYLGFQSHPGHSHNSYNYHVPQTGEYYILLITNFSKQPCVISFTKQPDSGPGTTDCSIIQPFLTTNTPCCGSTLQLRAEEILGASYQWTGPDGQTSNNRIWTRENATLSMSGQYSCHVTSGNQSGTEVLNVIVLPNVNVDFTVGNTIAGEPVQFTGTETTSPSGHNDMINERHWSFGDGTTSTSINPTHTYNNPGTYNVTYTASATGGNGGACEGSKTKTITITNQFNTTASAASSDICEGVAATLTATAAGGYGSYTYTWTSSPACQIDYPNSANTTAHPSVGTTTFTCTISDGNSAQTPSVAVVVHPEPMADAGEDQHVNYHGVATLSAATVAGASYSWTPANQINGNANQQTVQTKQLEDMTTFTVRVTSQYGCWDEDEVIVTVGNQLQGSATITGPTSICEGEETTIKANPAGGTGAYTYSWSPAQYVDDPTAQTTTVHPTLTVNQFTCTISDGDASIVVSTGITVNPMPQAVASSNYTNVLAGNYVILTAQPVADASCSWEPNDMISDVIDPWTVKTVTLPENENTEFTLTVTTSSGCSSEDNVVLSVYQELDNSSVASLPDYICEDNDVELSATAVGGTGNFTYHWEPAAYVDNPDSQTTVAHPTLDTHIFTCMILDNGIDDPVNNKIYKSVDVEVHEKPHIDTELIGRDYIVPGLGMIPYIYEYYVDMENLHGYGIGNPELTEYQWSINTYSDVPNHVPGTPDQSTWTIQVDESGTKAYVFANAEGYALLRCAIVANCGIAYTEKFIYTNNDYIQYQSVTEINYDDMISVYPNPSNGEINIWYDGNIVEAPMIISIYSYNGTLVNQFETTPGNSIIKCSMVGHANGLYFIKINGKDFTVTKKLLLDR